MRCKFFFCLSLCVFVAFVFLTPRVTLAGRNSLIDTVVQANSEFAIELYKKICVSRENVFMSPFGVSEALAMAYAGAKGDTEKQMRDVLHFASLKEDVHLAFSLLEKRLLASGSKDYKMYIANAMWMQKGYRFLPSFKRVISSYYNGALFTVDYMEHLSNAVRSINRWVEEKTNGKIKGIIKKGDLDCLVRLVLTNAIYFRGEWLLKFNKRFTRKGDFYTIGGKVVEVPMMFQEARFPYYENSRLQALNLPYEGKDFLMLVVLPKRGVDLRRIEKGFSVKWLRELRDNMQNERVKLYMPRFTLDTRYYLKDILSSMGMPDAFSDRADFSGMTGNKKLKISKVIHQAHVSVNECGTEATAATAVVLKLKSAVPVGRVLVFKADHPFIFVIFNRSTGSILFVGRLGRPM